MPGFPFISMVFAWVGPGGVQFEIHNLIFAHGSSCSLSLRRHAHGPLAERLMHMAHKIGNTSGVSKSSSDWLNYTGFPGDVCVAFRLETKMPWHQTPHKEESRRVYNCDDVRLSGSTKRWILSLQHRIFKIRPRVLHCYWGDISTPQNVTLKETNCD